MRIKGWFRGWRLYVVLMAAGLLTALIVINQELFKSFVQHFQVPIHFLFICAGITIGLCIGKAHTEENQNKPETTDSLATEKNDMPPAASGDTCNRIGKAIFAFPVQYPDYKTFSPKLDADIRPWLKESGIAKNDRESHVFGSIISEHYKLSPDR